MNPNTLSRPFSLEFEARAYALWDRYSDGIKARDSLAREYAALSDPAREAKTRMLFGLIAPYLDRAEAPYLLADLQHLYPEGGHPLGEPCAACTDQAVLCQVVTR